ncbi:MAG: urea transporter [Bacteroidota bacterium]|nr:urea transporter [Bacteroidota bacterium]
MTSASKKILENYWLKSTLNSYSLIFFSLNNVFALLILIVTFFSPYVGFIGLLSVVTTNFFSTIIGFGRDEIKSGLFGFNALLLGLALGYEFTPTLSFIALFFSAIILLIMITAWLKGLFSRHNVPFLSFPFLISYWIISLSSSGLSTIFLDEHHAYVANEIVKNQDSLLYQIIHSLDDTSFFPFAIIYFKTLAGTFFQSSVLGGMIIAFGLLYFSRISFSLSIIGFGFAYLFYSIFGANVNDLNYFLQGSNFIFFAIAIGCFFLIPNIHSYIAVIILIPILMLLLMSFGKILSVFNLNGYTFSFSLLTTAFLFSLNQRWFQKYFQITTIQYFSAEKTIYKYLNSVQRFKNEHLMKISLPFFGEWNVSQGYDGTITHLGQWSKALDFVIEDNKNNTYREPGTQLEHFYCYNREIIAPADGYIYDIINTVDENDIGSVDTERNWGNTIIMNHLNGLFSQISHIKKDSIVVEIGQYVYRGTFLATCGNSGRSPEPHIHFQLQTLPTIGYPPIPYPFGYYILRKGKDKFLKYSEVPNQGDNICNVQVNLLFTTAFNFYPGVKVAFQKQNSNEKIILEVFTDAWNRTYFYCVETNSYAYFINDGIMFYFTDFEGDKNSLLFGFYLAGYRQLLGYYDNIKITDNVPLIHFNNKLLQPFQDVVAPFYLFTKAKYSSTFSFIDNVYAPQHSIISTEVETQFLNRTFKKTNFEIEVKDNRINKFTIYKKGNTEIYFFSLVY